MWLLWRRPTLAMAIILPELATLFHESESRIGLQLTNLPIGKQAAGVFFCPYFSSPGVTACTTIPGFFMWIWGWTHVLRPVGQVIALLAELSLKLKLYFYEEFW